MKFDNILWDWNGTLLNDVEIAVSVINQLLGHRKLKQLSLAQYLDVFTFPVRDYYTLIGFDLVNEPFEIPANQYITLYSDAVGSCGLHEGVVPVLQKFHDRGTRQFILSAMEQRQLELTVAANGIAHYFENLCGLNDHYAVSKVEIGRSLIESKQLNPDATLIIGDTLHDYEVAQALGCKCLLVANGHQSPERLKRSGAKVHDRVDGIVF